MHDSEAVMVLNDLTDTVNAFKQKEGRKIQELETEMNSLNERVTGLAMHGGGGGGHGSSSRTDAAKNAFLGRFAREGGNGDFAQFARQKMPDVNATMFVGSDPDGGWLDLPTVDPVVRRIAQNISPLRGLANVKTISTGEYKVLLDPSQVGSGWVGEQQSRPTTDTSKLVEVRIPVNEVYAAPAMTQSLIDDVFIDLGAWVTESVNIAFASKEGSAFVVGDGVLKPRGFLTYALDSADDFTRTWGKLQYVATGATSPTAVQLAEAILALSVKLDTAPVRQRLRVRRVVACRREQLALQRRVVELGWYRPRDADHRRPTDVLSDHRAADPQRLGNHPGARPAGVLQAQNFSYLPHRQSLGGHRSLPLAGIAKGRP
jgi:HK97 family phage major capsid protein